MLSKGIILILMMESWNDDSEEELLFWCIVGKALYFLHSMISCHVAAVVVVSSIFKGVLVILRMKSWRVFYVRREN